MGIGEEEEPNTAVVIVKNVYGDVCIRKARRKRQKVLVKQLMYDYSNNTTLHGLPYLTRPGLTLIEKIFWLITFIASVCLCVYLITKVYIKWQNSPVIVTVSEELVPVYMVPFPSVTICPQSKCKVSVYNYTNEKYVLDSFMRNRINMANKTVNDTMRERIATFVGISEVCDLETEYELEGIYPEKHTNYSIVKNIEKIAPNHSDVFAFCEVHGKYQPCEKLFSTVLTSEGLCFNMNSLAAAEIFRPSLQKDYTYLNTTKPSKGWSVEHGYTQNFTYDDLLLMDEESDLYPAPGAENGEKPDIEIILQHRPAERDHLCNGINSGFKVYVQHPSDLPQSSLYYYAVLNNQVSSMALSFNVLNTSENLRNYDPEIRQCYFADERYLQYFKLYTSSNCLIECLSNITYKHCGCVSFYMPHTTSNRICTEENAMCMRWARRKMLRQELVKGDTRCHCLPSCNAVDYEAEILKTDYNLKRFIEAYRRSDDYRGFNFSKLEMYFKRPRFLSMRRSELFGLTDFLANCGGLLGLFLGFSFLSLVEIFYFLSLRLCCTLKKDLEEEKALNNQEKEVNDEKY